MFTALLAHRLPEIFGFLPQEGASEPREIWIQSWDPGHREVSVGNLRNQTDVNELAADAGTQLAGHFWTTFPEPLRGHQRFAQLRAFEMTERRARDLAAELARETVTDWSRFSGATLELRRPVVCRRRTPLQKPTAFTFSLRSLRSQR